MAVHCSQLVMRDGGFREAPAGASSPILFGAVLGFVPPSEL